MDFGNEPNSSWPD